MLVALLFKFYKAFVSQRRRSLPLSESVFQLQVSNEVETVHGSHSPSPVASGGQGPHSGLGTALLTVHPECLSSGQSLTKKAGGKVARRLHCFVSSQC